LGRVSSLRGVYYNWNHDSATRPISGGDTSRKVGVIAQEVQAVLPEAIVPLPRGFVEINKIGNYSSAASRAIAATEESGGDETRDLLDTIFAGGTHMHHSSVLTPETAAAKVQEEEDEEEEEEKLLGVRYSQIIPLLIEAIKEIELRVTTVQNPTLLLNRHNLTTTTTNAGSLRLETSSVRGFEQLAASLVDQHDEASSCPCLATINAGLIQQVFDRLQHLQQQETLLLSFLKLAQQ
jgi:hypothetical protein